MIIQKLQILIKIYIGYGVTDVDTFNNLLKN